MHIKLVFKAYFPVHSGNQLRQHIDFSSWQMGVNRKNRKQIHNGSWNSDHAFFNLQLNETKNIHCAGNGLWCSWICPPLHGLYILSRITIGCRVLIAYAEIQHFTFYCFKISVNVDTGGCKMNVKTTLQLIELHNTRREMGK